MATATFIENFLNRLREDVHDAGLGQCWLKQAELIEIVRSEIFNGDGSEFHVGDFIIMPNHVHLLMIPSGAELETCMKRIKGRAARFCNQVLGRRGAFWQADSFDHIVRNIDQLAKYRKYIRDNPLKAKVTVDERAYYFAPWM